MEKHTQEAPGAPGIPARWTSSAKSGVGTSLNPGSRVWFTLSHGIFNEIYYPRVDQACTRDFGLIVTDGNTFFSEEKRDTQNQTSYLLEGIPAFQIVNTCNQGRYRIEKEILSDPHRDVVLQQTRFIPLKGAHSNYHLYALLAPHLGNQGADNTAFIGDYKGVPMLFAERDGLALALASSAPWRQCSAGFVGFSDGWQDLSQHKKLTWQYSRASHGNVALVGEIELTESNEEFTLALGFGLNSAEAGLRALSSLQEGYPSICQAYMSEWANWQEKVKIPAGGTSTKKQNQLFRTSATVLRSHEAKRFPGGLIASLSFPWGFAKGDDDLGGYHLVWPRDLVEAAGGLLAIGAQEDAQRVLQYLRVTQEAEGNWPQNMWLDGRAFWNGTQMDETALPILLVDLARREGALSAQQTRDLWPMVRHAAGFLVRNGPVSPQDRWEEDPGYSPFTLAVEITALLAAADMAELRKEPQIAAYLRQTADTWNDNIERWTYISGSDLAKQVGVSGYYVRIAPPDVASSASLAEGFVPIKNRPPGESEQPASQIVSTDALALVRFGLRSPQDERILNTIKVIDASLKVETPNGPAWHRYTDDGYGEKADGEPFGGEPPAGIGRPWPLLTGERAHYELAAGNKSAAKQLQDALAAFANEGCMLAEQIWDAEDIPEKELFCGKPSGSAMPLVWAHAEYVKLCRSLSDGQVFDMPVQAVQRYLKQKTVSDFANWDFNQKIRSIPEGKKLRLETLEPARIRWSTDHWETAHDQPTQDTGLGIYYSDLPTDDLPPDAAIEFTFYWQASENWEDQEYSVSIEEKQHDKR